MVAPPSIEDIKAVYETTQPDCIHIANGIARIRDRGSDGDESRHPLTGEPVILWDNTVNYLREADENTVNHWLSKIGNYLIYEGLGEWHNLRDDRVYILKRFPLGYKLYTRFTGHKDDPRRDSYLYGSTTDRCREFRSPEEFVLHVKWMAFGKPTDDLGRPLCACCYCSKRPQGEISAMLRNTISHLNLHQSTNRPTGRSHAAGTTSRGPSAPIMAKDYSRLNEGEGVTRHVLENIVPPSYEREPV